MKKSKFRMLIREEIQKLPIFEYQFPFGIDVELVSQDEKDAWAVINRIHKKFRENLRELKTFNTQEIDFLVDGILRDMNFDFEKHSNVEKIVWKFLAYLGWILPHQLPDPREEVEEERKEMYEARDDGILFGRDQFGNIMISSASLAEDVADDLVEKYGHDLQRILRRSDSRQHIDDLMFDRNVLDDDWPDVFDAVVEQLRERGYDVKNIE